MKEWPTENNLKRRRIAAVAFAVAAACFCGVMIMSFSPPTVAVAILMASGAVIEWTKYQDMTTQHEIRVLLECKSKVSILMMLPAPTWFAVADVLLYVPAALWGARLGGSLTGRKLLPNETK